MSPSAPLRAIEAVAKLLAAHAIDNADQAGVLILEYLAELRALSEVTKGEKAVRWKPEDRDHAVLLTLQTRPSHWFTIRELLAETKWPVYMREKSWPTTCRQALASLITQHKVERRHEIGRKVAGQLQYVYTLAAAKSLKAMGEE